MNTVRPTKPIVLVCDSNTVFSSTTDMWLANMQSRGVAIEIQSYLLKNLRLLITAVKKKATWSNGQYSQLRRAGLEVLCIADRSVLQILFVIIIQVKRESTSRYPLTHRHVVLDAASLKLSSVRRACTRASSGCWSRRCLRHSLKSTTPESVRDNVPLSGDRVSSNPFVFFDYRVIKSNLLRWLRK